VRKIEEADHSRQDNFRDMAPPLAFLAVPATRETHLASIRRKVRLLAARTLLTCPPSLRGLGAVQAALTDALRRAPDPTLDALGTPDVLGPLLMLHDGIGDVGVLREAVPALLAGLAARRLLPAPVIWEEPVARVVDPASGRAWRFDPPGRALLAYSGGMELERADHSRVGLGAGDAPFHALSGGVALSLVDTNPLSMVEDHPEKQGNAVDLGGRDAGEWVAALDGALELVKLGLPTWFAELPVALQRLVPVGYEPERHLSASYREFPGLAYLTLHPDPVTMAEAIVHETQHGKLNLLTWLDPVLHNGRTFWTPSPVRPDLRPLMGVLLAVHAFVPVAALHAGLIAADHPLTRTPQFAARRQQVLAGNARGLALVQQHGDATDLGRRVIDGLARMHAELATGATAMDPEALPPG
jgi:HEXXH motif-containing protein